MKRTKEIFSAILSLVFALAVFTGCGKDNGANGWRYGNGAPESALGMDGDLYLDYADWNVWTKDNGAWTNRGSIKGEPGEQGGSGSQGSQGENGRGWHYGEGAPESRLGADGDLYLDFSTWDVYVKESGAWSFRKNINSDSEEYQNFFPEFTMTRGNLKVFNGGDPSQNFFMASIQGLFAQIGESKYYFNAGVPASFLAELNSIYGKASEVTTIDEMCTDYTNRFSAGYVLYDVDSAESTNCARTIAGAERLAMVSTALEDYATGRGLRKVVDATKMTAEQCFEQYKDKLSNKGLVYGDVAVSGEEADRLTANVGLTDFAIACRYFCYYPADSKEGGTDADDTLWNKPKDDRWSPLRNQVNAWCAGAPIYGAFPLGEMQTVKRSSRFDSPTIVGGDLYNLTVYGCAGFFGENVMVQKNRPAPISEEEYPIDRHYVTIANGDGDNLGVHLQGIIEDPNKYMGVARGDFPMGWEINPSLYALAPNVLRHYYNSVQAGDSYVCSISGFGHTFARYFSDRALARLVSGLDRFIGACDLPVVKLLDDGSMFDKAEDRVLAAYAGMKNAEGFLYSTYDGAYTYDYGSVRWMNGKPIIACSYTLWDWWGNTDKIAQAINGGSRDATKIEAYSYVNLHIWSRDYTTVKALVEKLDRDNVVIVDPLTFIRLVKARVPHNDVRFTEDDVPNVRG